MRVRTRERGHHCQDDSKGHNTHTHTHPLTRTHTHHSLTHAWTLWLLEPYSAVSRRRGLCASHDGHRDAHNLLPAPLPVHSAPTRTCTAAFSPTPLPPRTLAELRSSSGDAHTYTHTRTHHSYESPSLTTRNAPLTSGRTFPAAVAREHVVACVSGDTLAPIHRCGTARACCGVWQPPTAPLLSASQGATRHCTASLHSAHRALRRSADGIRRTRHLTLAHRCVARWSARKASTPHAPVAERQARHAQLHHRRHRHPPHHPRPTSPHRRASPAAGSPLLQLRSRRGVPLLRQPQHRLQRGAPPAGWRRVCQRHAGCSAATSAPTTCGALPPAATSHRRRRTRASETTAAPATPPTAAQTPMPAALTRCLQTPPQQRRLQPALHMWPHRGSPRSGRKGLMGKTGTARSA